MQGQPPLFCIQSIHPVVIHHHFELINLIILEINILTLDLSLSCSQGRERARCQHRPPCDALVAPACLFVHLFIVFFVYLFLFCFFSIALHVMRHCTSMRDAVQQKDWSKLGFRFEYWLKMVVFNWFCNRFIFSAGALAALMRHNRSQGHNTRSKSLQYDECNSGSSGYYSRDARISCNKQINATN